MMIRRGTVYIMYRTGTLSDAKHDIVGKRSLECQALIARENTDPEPLIENRNAKMRLQWSADQYWRPDRRVGT